MPCLSRLWFAALLLILLRVPSTRALAGNPYLTLPERATVTAEFRGKEWNDQYEKDELPLRAQVRTTHRGTFPFGSVYEITFPKVTSRATPARSIEPLQFLATEERIYRLNERELTAALRKWAVPQTAPALAETDLVAISSSSLTVPHDSLSEAVLTVKGDTCTFLWHHNSGHSTTIVWQRGVGLIRYALNYGARRDGLDLRRTK